MAKMKSIQDYHELGFGKDENGDSKNKPVTVELANYFNEIKLVKNEITRCYEIEGKEQSEDELNGLYLDFREKKQPIQKNLFFTTLHSNRVKMVNPILEKLSLLKPDGKDHIGALCNSIQLDATSQFTEDQVETYFRKWFVGIAAGLHGRPNPLMMLFIGEISTGKTYFFEKLLPKWLLRYLAMSHLDQGKDSEIMMGSNVLVLVDEFRGMQNKTASELRRIISADQYDVRPPYGKQNIKVKRLASVAATSNDENVIPDPANNRRIIPISISCIDRKKYNAVDKEQMFVQAYQLATNNFECDLDMYEQDNLKVASKEFDVSYMESELLRKFFARPESNQDKVKYMTAAEVFEYVNHNTSGKLKIRSQKVSIELKQLGFERISMRRKNGKGYPEKCWKVVLISGHLVTPDLE